MWALLLLFCFNATAGIVDQGVPQDALGHYEIDLYDFNGNQRGTNSNPLYTSNILDQTASGTITAQDTATTSATQASGQVVISGTPTSGSSISLALSSVETVMVGVTGTWTGTLQVETFNANSGTWIPHAIHLIGGPIFTANFTQNVQGSLNASAKTQIRVRSTAAFTGSAVVTFTTSGNPSNIYVANSLKIVDGTATSSAPLLAIKAASTAPVATDPAAVVALSPNVPYATSTLQNSIISLLTTITGQLPVASSYSAKQVTGNTSVQLKTGAGVLHVIVIGNNATGGTLALYDGTSTSGAVLTAVNAGTPTSGLLSTTGAPGAATIGPLDIKYTTGLFATTVNSTNNYFTVVFY